MTTKKYAAANKNVATISQCRFEEASTALNKIITHVNPATGAIEIPSGRAVTYATRLTGDPAAPIKTFDGRRGYGVYRNASWDALEAALSCLEDGGQGILTSSGRAAIELVLKLLPKDSHIVVTPNDLYPGTRNLFSRLAETTGLEVTYADCTKKDLEAALKLNTRLIFSESLTNPRLQVADLDLIVNFAKQHDLINVSDNTLAPLLIKPLACGFDISLHSLTKYIAGHNDTIGGAIIVNRNQPDIAKKLLEWRDAAGQILSPSDASNILSRIVDFPVRLKTHSSNGLALARWLEERPEIEHVYYPTLESCETYELAQQHLGDAGAGLISFTLKNTPDAALNFLRAAQENFLIADSFGASVTMLNWPARQSAFFSAMTEEQRLSCGITDQFFRIAVGREGIKSIIERFDECLSAISRDHDKVAHLDQQSRPLQVAVRSDKKRQSGSRRAGTSNRRSSAIAA